MFYTWVAVEIVVLFWLPTRIQHLIVRETLKGIIILTTTHMSSQYLRNTKKDRNHHCSTLNLSLNSNHPCRELAF